MRELLANGSEFSLFQAAELIDRFAAHTEPGLRRGPGETGENLSHEPFEATVGEATVGEATVGDATAGDATAGDARRAGAYLPPSKESIRFRAVRDMGFPPADIARIALEEAPADASEQTRTPPRHVIEATCLGLYGPDSPLPSYINERIVARDRDATALRDFLDLFNHRLLSLLCRIARRYRHIRIFDGLATDEISLLCRALIGESEPHALPPNGAECAHRLRNATRLGRFSMSAPTLEAIVSDRLGGIGVRVEEFVRRTVFIRNEQRNRLGERGNILGDTSLLGDRVASRSCRIRLRLGPLDSAGLDGLLPGGPARRTLDKLLRRVLPVPFDYEVVLRVAADAVVPACLGGAGRLALDAWLGEAEEETALRFGTAT